MIYQVDISKSQRCLNNFYSLNFRCKDLVYQSDIYLLFLEDRLLNFFYRLNFSCKYFFYKFFF